MVLALLITLGLMIVAPIVRGCDTKSVILIGVIGLIAAIVAPNKFRGSHHQTDSDVNPWHYSNQHNHSSQNTNRGQEYDPFDTHWETSTNVNVSFIAHLRNMHYFCSISTYNMKEENKIILYQDDNEITRVSVRFADEDVWLTQNQLAEIYDTTQQNIALHIKNIYADGELSEERTYKDFLLVRQEGSRQVKRNIVHYNLDMIIALGYRVQSQVATRFRRWATQRLHEYIQKGFAMDDERLKQGGNRYFRELLQRIRDIRSSERNFYQQVTDIYATATDYDPRDEMTKAFFATVQNKLHYAVHENTAAEVIYYRVDNEKPFVGMTNFKGNYVTRDDVKIAKNYLTEIELQRLNLLVSGFLDFAEFQALEMNPMTMNDWIKALDNQIIGLKRKVLIGKGHVSHKQAIEKAEKEFEIYRKREMDLLESDFDKEIKRLKDLNFQK